MVDHVVLSVVTGLLNLQMTRLTPDDGKSTRLPTAR